MQRLGKSSPDKAPAIEWEEKTVGTRGPSPRIVKVPKGIDPGFAYTPGKSRLQSSLEMFATKAESVPPRLADQMINRVVESKTFERWYQNPTGTFPIARLPDEDAALIGAKQHIVGLSEQMAKKQLKEHAEILAAEYLAIQLCISRGERIQDGDRSLVYILNEEDGHVSVVKSTQNGGGLFLSSFRRLSKAQAKQDSEINRLRRK